MSGQRVGASAVCVLPMEAHWLFAASAVAVALAEGIFVPVQALSSPRHRMKKSRDRKNLIIL